MRKNLVALLIALFIFLPFSEHSAFAASATIGLVPNNGSYGKPFTVDMVVDGHGEKFNAAQATVNLPQNLSISDLTLGDCNFSFIHTPTIQNPSFSGVISSTSSTKCKVYSLTLVPKAKGNAAISISKGSVKRYGDAIELFSSAVNGSYNLTAAVTPLIMGHDPVNTSQQGLYTLYLKVYSTGTSPVYNAQVALTSVSEKTHQQAITDNTGTAHFSNLKTGIYDVVVSQGLNKVGETIINVSGSNHVLSLAVDLSSQKSNPLMKIGTLLSNITTNPIILAVVLVSGVIIGILVAIVIIKLISKRKNKSAKS